MYSNLPVSRREMLFRCANGFGGLALAGLLADKSGGWQGRWLRSLLRGERIGNLSVHGWRPFADRHLRSQAAAEQTRAWPVPAVQSRPRTVFNIGDKMLKALAFPQNTANPAPT